MSRSNFTKFLFHLSVLLALTSCIGGGSDGGFGDLIGGNLSDVDELTIISTSPAGTTVTVGVGATQTFTILAQTPPPASVSYYFTLDGVNVSNTNSYDLTGTNPLIGNHTVTATATDGTASKSRSWTVKVNGPPSISSAYSTPPKVTFDYDLNLTVSATDPNGDPITYEWRVGDTAGTAVADPAALPFTNNTATFTPPNTMVGRKYIKVIATDDSGASSEHSFEVHVTAFSNACNTMAQYGMCTYVGTPSLGDGLNPSSVTEATYVKIRPIAITQDTSNGNLILADSQHNLIWYWNKTGAAVERLGFTGVNAIPANTIKVIAGTGEAAAGGGDQAIDLPGANPKVYF